MKTKYIMTKNTYFELGNKRVGYGIAAITKEHGTETLIEEYHDMSHDRERIKELVKLCNKEGLSLIHLADVAEDFVSV